LKCLDVPTKLWHVRHVLISGCGNFTTCVFAVTSNGKTLLPNVTTIGALIQNSTEKIMHMVISRIWFIPYKKNHANESFYVIYGKVHCHVRQLRRVGSQNTAPFCETNNEHGKGEKPQALSRHTGQDDEEYIENQPGGKNKMITKK